MSAAHDTARPVMILAGGTGGHIFPGLAVARVLRERGVPVTWMGADGAMETRLVPQHDIAIDTLAITGLRGKGKLALLAAPWRLMRALRAAGMIIRKRQPRAVVAFGGFASGPGGMATRLHGLPLIVHEQNRAPGLTNRILSRYARRLLTGFPGTFAKREEFVGNPVRAEIAAIAPPEQRFADRHGPLRVLVVGGSQGHEHSTPVCRRRLPRWVTACRCRSATRVERRCMPRRSRRMPRPACRLKSLRSSPTWPTRSLGPIWSCAVPARPPWPSCARSVSAACWCHSPPPSTITRPAMRSTWLSAARRFC